MDYLFISPFPVWTPLHLLRKAGTQDVYTSLILGFGGHTVQHRMLLIPPLERTSFVISPCRYFSYSLVGSSSELLVIDYFPLTLPLFSFPSRVKEMFLISDTLSLRRESVYLYDRSLIFFILLLL